MVHQTRRAGIFLLMFVWVTLMAGVCPAAEDQVCKPARYVFLIIGDGMAQPQRTSTENYLAAKQGKPIGAVRLTMSRLPAQGMFSTFTADSIIPDSAGTATSMACGVKTNSGMVGVTPAGRPVASIAEIAKERGMKVGIISTVSLDHATPAGFYAHQVSRNHYHEIEQELVKSGFDFFGGGGLKDPEGKKAKDQTRKINVWEAAREAGYKIVTNKDDFEQLSPKDGKVLVVNEWLQDSKAMPYFMDRTEKDLSLAELVTKAAEMLDGPEGFFIMAEGGKLDWACHANDAVAALNEMIDIDKAVQAAQKFSEKHPDETLILVLGDHETGGLTLGFAGTRYDSHYQVLESQKMSFVKFSDTVVGKYKKSKTGDFKFDDLKPAIEEAFGFKFEGDPKDVMVLKDHEISQIEDSFQRSMAGEDEGAKDPETYLLYGGYDPLTVTLTHLLNQKAGLGWTSYSHTGLPVTASAVGVQAELFNGFYDNTDVCRKLKAAMGFPTEARTENP